MVTVLDPVEKPMSCGSDTIFCKAEASSASLDSSAVPESVVNPVILKRKRPVSKNTFLICNSRKQNLLFGLWQLLNFRLGKDNKNCFRTFDYKEQQTPVLIY